MTQAAVLLAAVGAAVVVTIVVYPRLVDRGRPASGLALPSMNVETGRKLFASKGCVVCHSVHGIGGSDAVPLDASTMPGMTDPFDFVANMWRGAEPMIALQHKELGGQIQFTGQELADIVAFLHDDAEQQRFSTADIPPGIAAAMEKMAPGDAGAPMKDMP